MRGDRLLVVSLPRGAQVTTFGDLLVVVGPPPFEAVAIDRWTGVRVPLSELRSGSLPPEAVTPWSLVPKE